MIRRPVSAGLAGFVTDLVHYRETFSVSSCQVETASLVVPLVIVLGERFRIGLGREPSAPDSYASFTSGLFAGPVVIRSCGAMECVQVNFTPVGARRFFGLPMSELSGRMVQVDTLPDPDLAGLSQRLGELADPETRLDLVEAFVARRILMSAKGDRIAEAAYAMLLATGGDLRVGDLASRLETSRKHVAQRFHDMIGLPPKAVSRIIRFNAAKALAASGGEWADIAYACGYADQAHLSREFLDLSGSTPTDWRRAA